MKVAKTALLAVSAFAFSGAAWAADKPLDGTNNDGKLSKREAANASRSDDSGFAKLDKNKDGYISKVESAGSAAIRKEFTAFDRDNDGKLNRVEYLALAAKEDAIKLRDGVGDAIGKEPAGAGSPAAPASPTAPGSTMTPGSATTPGSNAAPK